MSMQNQNSEKMVQRTTLAGNQSRVDATSRRGTSGVPLVDGSLRRLASSSSGLRSGLLLLLLLDLLGVTVEEHVNHNVPAVGGAGDGAAETEDLAGEEPPHKTDGVAGLVVRRNGDVDELEGRVGVAEGDNRDVDVARLADGLVVDARVGHDDEARLLERARDVVRERTGREAACDRLRARVGGVLEHGAVPERPRGDDADVVRVLDRGDDARGEHELLPSLANVDDVDT